MLRFFFVVFVFLVLSLFAQSTDIVLQKEYANIKVHKNYAKFDITYTFINHSSKAQKVTLKLPRKKQQLEEKLDWYLFETEFGAKERKEIKNSYWVFPGEYRGLYSLFYKISTGITFSKSIKKVDVEVELDESFAFSPIQLAKSNILISPKGYTIQGQKLTWSFTNLTSKSEDDIEIYFIKDGKPYATLSDTASSTLNNESLEGVYFGAENLLDGNFDFSWATNNEKGPIGEWVQIDFLDAPHDIQKIGIYPGYGEKESFLMADHLKIATLIFSNGSSQTLYFEEIPTMQYFDIKKDNITFFKIRIDEVYEGSFEKKGYKGTVHIGEVSIYDK